MGEKYLFDQFKASVARDLKDVEEKRFQELYKSIYENIEHKIREDLKPIVMEECKKLYYDSIKKQVELEMAPKIMERCMIEIKEN